jgi:CO/xanthine dehydrogenase Mo-binding subunit
MNWNRPFERGTGTLRRGRGIAVGFKAVISPTTSVSMIILSADGSCTLHCNTIDMGQGSDTAMSQIAADTLGIPMDAIKVVSGDTAVTPYDMGTLGSRSTFHMGHAVIAAATDARQKLQALAIETGLEIGVDATISDVFRKKYGMLAGNIVGVGTYSAVYSPVNPENGLSTNITPFWMSGACGVEIEVDTETGHVRIMRLVNVADAGTAINPDIVDTQLSGASIMALGGTMSECMEYTDGELTNGAFAYYKIPGMHDFPDIVENNIVESAQKSGPFGAKGVGESASFGVSPAIANAIHDAIGLRLTALPLSPESVYRGLRTLQGNPLEEE